jgi:hypothetical protein
MSDIRKIHALNLTTGRWELTDDPDDLDLPEATVFPWAAEMFRTLTDETTVRIALVHTDDPTNRP